MDGPTRACRAPRATVDPLTCVGDPSEGSFFRLDLDEVFAICTFAICEGACTDDSDCDDDEVCDEGVCVER